MSETPRISVIIPHYNDFERLDRCLDALTRQSLPVDQFEVIVADNMSSGGESVVRRVINGRALLAIAAARGAGPARNAGAAAARGPILAFTDSDCVPGPHWLAEGMAALAKRDFVGGRMTVLVPDERRMSGAEAFERVFAFNNERYVGQEHFTVTANLFCPRALFERVGGFRTEVSEDIEWCLRARDMGARIGYAEKAVVGHPARADWPQLKKKWARMAAENYQLSMSRGGTRAHWFLRCWALLGSVVPHALVVLRSPSISGMGNRMAALGTLVRIRCWRFVEGHRLLFRS